MTKRTRAFVLAASAIVVLGIGTAGVASYVGLGGFALLGQQADDELSLVPADAELIGYADVRHLMSSDLRQRLLGADGLAGRSPDELLARTGINIETDVDSIFVIGLPAGDAAANPEAAGAVPPTAPVLLARGRFDRGRIEALVLEQNGQVEEHGGIWLSKSATEDIGVAFIEADLVAAGPAAAVARLLDHRAAGGASARDNDELMRLVNRVDDASTWTVVRFDALRNASAVPQELASQLPAITWFAASGQVDSGVAATIYAEARDAQAAQDLGEVIRGFVALVRMQVGPQPAFADVIDSIQLSTEGTTVTLAFSVPPAVIERLGTMTRPQPPASPIGASAREPVLPGPSI